MLIAQFTDLHIVRPHLLALDRVDTAARLQACIKTLALFDPAPELLLLTGDLADHSDPEEYAHLRELLAPLRIPHFVIPGNHDRRAALRAAFSDHSYLGVAGQINFALEQPGLRILALDSLVEGEDWGELGASTLDWLAARLADVPRTPALVVVHHPPIPIGEGAIDSLGLRDADALGAVVESNPQVVAVISGHYHRAVSAKWRGTSVVVAPSTAQAIDLDFAPGRALCFRLEPPAFCLHRWDGSMLASHVVQAGDFAGPYSYD